MWATASFNANDPVRRQNLHAYQGVGIFLGVDVVGDDTDRICVTPQCAKCCRKGRFTRADRAANTDAKRAV